MKSILRYIVILIQLLAGLIWIPFWMVASGAVCIQWHGFGVDTSGNVYVGKEEQIEKYYEGQYIGSFDIPRFRSYRMTVERDIIVVATSTFVYRFDLEGNELSCVEDTEGVTHARIGEKMKSSRGPDGVEYIARTSMRHKIVRGEGTVVYRMHVRDYIVKLFYGATCTAFFGLGFIAYIKRKYYCN